MTIRRLTGTQVRLSSTGDASAFVPNPLPPVPPVSFEGGLRALLDRALLGLGRLDSITTLLPNPDLFLYSYVRKEALLSSQIDGGAFIAPSKGGESGRRTCFDDEESRRHLGPPAASG